MNNNIINEKKKELNVNNEAGDLSDDLSALLSKRENRPWCPLSQHPTIAHDDTVIYCVRGVTCLCPQNALT